MLEMTHTQVQNFGVILINMYWYYNMMQSRIDRGQKAPELQYHANKHGYLCTIILATLACYPL